MMNVLLDTRDSRKRIPERQQPGRPTTPIAQYTWGKGELDCARQRPARDIDGLGSGVDDLHVAPGVGARVADLQGHGALGVCANRKVDKQ